MARRLHAEKVPLKDASLRQIYMVTHGPPRGLTVCGPFLGAPHAVMGLEKLIALGAKRFWVLGWCGSIHESLRIGDILLPTVAFSDEGTSRHYPLKGRISGSPGLGKLLEQQLKRKSISFVKGGIWTTDAPYMETPQKVIKFRDRGAKAVEMECSALMRVARFRGVGLTALLVVSDELFQMKWRPGFALPRLQEATRVAAECLLEAVLAQEEEER